MGFSGLLHWLGGEEGAAGMREKPMTIGGKVVRPARCGIHQLAEAAGPSKPPQQWISRSKRGDPRKCSDGTFKKANLAPRLVRIAGWMYRWVAEDVAGRRATSVFVTGDSRC